MSKYSEHRYVLLSLMVLLLIAFGSMGSAMAAQENDAKEITRAELAKLDEFLDAHPQIAKDLKKNPKLVNNEDYLEKHSELREFLKDHPAVREDLKEHPRAFMARERRFEQAGRDITRTELRNFDEFLDKHPEVTKELKKNPSLVNNEDFLEKHPELREFLKQHPRVREDLKEHPRAFMARERRFERSGRDINRTELRNFDEFLDKHPEVTKELKKNPSLVNNEDFLEKHPELREFLKQHPRVREDLKEHPRAFMRRERGFDRHERSEARRKRR